MKMSPLRAQLQRDAGRRRLQMFFRRWADHRTIGAGQRAALLFLAAIFSKQLEGPS